MNADLEIAIAIISTAALCRSSDDMPEDNTYGLPEGEGLADEMRKWFAKQQKAVLAKIPKNPIAPIPEDLPHLADWTDPMARAFVPYISAEWDKSGKETTSRLGFDPSTFNVTSPHLRPKIEAATLAFTESTNQTTSKQIATAVRELRASLAEGLADRGETVPFLTARVQAVFENASTHRAKKIAATESSRAYHAAQEAAGVESEVVAGLELLLSSDACPLCRKIATECRRVPLGQPFAVIGHHPDYSHIKHPPLHPNCQCTVIEVLKPEYGGPPDPGFRETLIQPKVNPDDSPPAGKVEPKPEPGKARPQLRPAAPKPEPPPTVIVKPERRADLDHVSRVLFGRTASDHELAALFGAPPDAEVHVAPHPEHTSITSHWTSPEAGATRTVYRDPAGATVLRNISLHVDRKAQGHGLGTRILARQVDAATALRVAKITTIAQRDDADGEVGYAVWPKLGYDAPIPSAEIRETPPDDATLISDLMRTARGRAWWAKFGRTVELAFDLRPDSLSRRVLAAKLARKTANETPRNE